MSFPSKLSAWIASCALIGTVGLGHAHAAEDSLYDLQPCPDSLAVEGGAKADKTWDLTLSPFTHHWHSSSEHKPVKLVALDRHVSGGRFCGLALFTNSFGQPSAYGYVGQQWNNILGNPQLFTKVSAGFIYGYRGKHKDAIGFNSAGIAPAIIPSLGYAFNPKESAQAFLLGTAGVTFAYVRSF
ncbi:hypothetical protein LMORI2_17760 [Limnohabitans sp. MORI2]|uniref:hypothetical protein n=1 Tax=Limnohabitans sp. MORI2 TaxID=1751150 RepID=UPI0023775D08|nr:hypothetical protein [Limnohabitans sp. MORI2]BDU58794.1 hypothetical protein LMORI2_17760 [Limnohabitans sp. MORI2]